MFYRNSLDPALVCEVLTLARCVQLCVAPADFIEMGRHYYSQVTWSHSTYTLHQYTILTFVLPPEVAPPPPANIKHYQYPGFENYILCLPLPEIISDSISFSSSSSRKKPKEKT